MAKEWARAFYHSKPWENIREFVKRRDKGLCQRCKRHGKIETGKIVHHIDPLTPENINDPNISLNADNLEMVCKQCHEEEHKKLGYGALNHSKVESRVRFDSEGNVVKLN